MFIFFYFVNLIYSEILCSFSEKHERNLKVEILKVSRIKPEPEGKRSIKDQNQNLEVFKKDQNQNL